MAELDPRIIRIGIEVNGVLRVYNDLAMTAEGTKYANDNQDECTITITNLKKDVQDFLLTETSPFNKSGTKKSIFVEAGRESYGVFRLFEGDISDVSPTQPPDIAVTIKALTGNAQKGVMVSTAQPGQALLSKIAGQVAKDLGVGLNFQAKDKQISNYTFTGANLKQIDKLGTAGGVNAFLDGKTLVVKDVGKALPGKLRVLSQDSGMIGIPEPTEQGVKVTYLLDNTSTIGGGLRLTSAIYPSMSGDYSIYKLGFNIASRDVPFYWIAEGTRS
jgi:hypothetical protein